MNWFKQFFSTIDTLNLSARLEKVEHDMRRLEEEWTEVYGKFRTLQLRVAKQAQRLEANSAEAEPQGAENGETTIPPVAGPAGSSFSPAQQRLQEQILQRRARGESNRR